MFTRRSKEREIVRQTETELETAPPLSVSVSPLYLQELKADG